VLLPLSLSTHPHIFIIMSTCPTGALELLDPSNCVVIFIDHQPAMTFGVANIDRQTLINNTV